MSRWLEQFRASPAPIHATDNRDTSDKSPDRAAIVPFVPFVSGMETPTRPAITTAAEADQPHIVLLHVPNGVPLEWAQGVSNLLAMTRPARWPERAWSILREDAFAFLRDHAADAHRLGWSTLDLFGICPRGLLNRPDGVGLVPALDGRRIVELRAEAAVIEAGRHRLTHRRHPDAHSRVPVFRLDTAPRRGDTR